MKKQLIIDADIHQTYTHHREVAQYMTGPFRTRCLESGFGYPGGMYYSSVGGVRKDAFPENGVPGSSYELMKEQHLDFHHIDVGILNGGAMLGINLMTEYDYPAALASAYNDWLLDTWLKKDKRFLGSMMIASQNIEASISEVQRLGAEDKIVQVLISAVTPIPLGNRHYHKLYEICQEFCLPIALHPGGNQSSGTAPVPTPVGFPSYYLEWHTLLPSVYMAQISSLVTEGVFEKFKSLKFNFIEGGVSWLAPFMWRFDKNYKALRSQTPWLKKLPSRYITDNCFFTTQPSEEPQNTKDLQTFLEAANIMNNVLYSSDYPHWDYDTPQFATRTFTEENKLKILGKNAKRLYRLKS
jgi:uncharacterized protein